MHDRELVLTLIKSKGVEIVFATKFLHIDHALSKEAVQKIWYCVEFSQSKVRKWWGISCWNCWRKGYALKFFSQRRQGNHEVETICDNWTCLRIHLHDLRRKKASS